MSKDADIGDLMSGANAEKIRRRSSVSAFAAEDMTVGLPGGCMDAIVVALKAAHGKESAVPPTLFVDAQREIGLSVRDGFRSLVSKKSLEDCLGFQPQAPCVMSIFDTNVSGEPGVASLSAWYRTMCRLKGCVVVWCTAVLLVGACATCDSHVAFAFSAPRVSQRCKLQ